MTAIDVGFGSGSFCTNSEEDGDGVSALFQYRGRAADLHLADAFIDTPQFSDEDNMWHLEAAFVWGPFSMQGEYAELEAEGARNIITGSTTTSFSEPVTPVNPTYWLVR